MKANELKEWFKHEHRSIIEINLRWLWLSIKDVNKCLFSRRNGYRGKIIFGYSVCFKLFNKNIL